MCMTLENKNLLNAGAAQSYIGCINCKCASRMAQLHYNDATITEIPCCLSIRFLTKNHKTIFP